MWRFAGSLNATTGTMLGLTLVLFIQKATATPMFSEPRDFTSATTRAVVLVPTCNPGPRWAAFWHALQAQDARSVRMVVLDSETDDGSLDGLDATICTVHQVRRATFNHGGTRQDGVDQFAMDAEFVVFLTQDAILAEPQTLTRLLAAFDDPQVAAVYGRQLPHSDANPIAAHARRFNYPEEGHTLALADKEKKGLKTCFLSNSFAAYRVGALHDAGGFARDVILGEDMHLAARLLLAGHAIRYESSALVYHSHNYSLLEEFGRYFDTGVFHSRQDWLLQTFGAATGEGFKYVHSEFKFILENAFWRLPEMGVRTALKFAGYRLGRCHARWPRAFNRAVSMHKGYWA